MILVINCAPMVKYGDAYRLFSDRQEQEALSAAANINGGEAGVGYGMNLFVPDKIGQACVYIGGDVDIKIIRLANPE